MNGRGSGPPRRQPVCLRRDSCPCASALFQTWDCSHGGPCQSYWLAHLSVRPVWSVRTSFNPLVYYTCWTTSLAERAVAVSPVPKRLPTHPPPRLLCDDDLMAYRFEYWWHGARFAMTLPLMLLAVVAASAQASSIRQEQPPPSFLWRISHDNLTISAPGCFFGSSGDIRHLVTKVEDCAPACVKNAQCTYFDWSSPNGGKCHLKGGPVVLSDADSSNIDGAVCGLLLPGSRDQGKDGGGDSAGRALALAGCFAGGAFAASAVAGLLVWRARRKRSANAFEKWGVQSSGDEPGAGSGELSPTDGDVKGNTKSFAVAPQPTPTLPAPCEASANQLVERKAAQSVGRLAVGAVQGVAARDVPERATAAKGTSYIESNTGMFTVWGRPSPAVSRVAEATVTEIPSQQLMVMGPPPSPPPGLWVTQDVEEWRARTGTQSVPPASSTCGSGSSGRPPVPPPVQTGG